MASLSEEIEQEASFSSPQEEALLSLMRSADHLHRVLQLKLRPAGLTSTQYNVLRILRGSRATGLTCSAIGRRMITPEPDITRLLARLKAQKLVCQQRDSHDRRVLWTLITQAGLDLLSSLDEMVQHAPKEMFQSLNHAEVIELTRLLTKLRSCPGSEGPGSECPGLQEGQKSSLEEITPERKLGKAIAGAEAAGKSIPSPSIQTSGKRLSPLPLHPHPRSE